MLCFLWKCVAVGAVLGALGVYEAGGFFFNTCVHYGHKQALSTSLLHEKSYRVKWPRHPSRSPFLLTFRYNLKISGLLVQTKLFQNFWEHFNSLISYNKNPVNKIMFLMATSPILLLYKLLLSVWDFLTIFKPHSFCDWCITWRRYLSLAWENDVFWQIIS